MSLLKIFSIRNYVKKQLIKPNAQGIMTIPDPGKIDFGEMLIKENLFRKGIDPKTISSEKQLDNILNTPVVEPKTAPKKSGEVIEVDFDKGRRNIDWEAVEKTDIEDFAQGGRTGRGLNYLLGEDDQNMRVPFQDGLSTNKISLDEIVGNVIGEREPPQLNAVGGRRGLAGMAQAHRPAAQRNRIKNKVINSFIYAVDNMDQETSEYVKELFNGALQIGYETDTSGIKTDLWDKGGIVPINSETLYKTIINLDLPKDIKAKMTAISNMAGDEELSASLKKNNMGITWDSNSQEIIGEYMFTLDPEGNTKIKPMIIKDADSQISKEIKIDQAIGDGILNFTLNESDIANSKGKEINYKNDSLELYAQNVKDDDKNWSQAGGTVEIPFYLLNKEEKPFISAEVFKDMDSDFEAKQFSGAFPITDNWKLWANRYEDDDEWRNETDYGLSYLKKGDVGKWGNWFAEANIDKDADWDAQFGIKIPFGQPDKEPFTYSTNNPEDAFDLWKATDGFKHEPNQKRELPQIYADGGIARIGLKDGHSPGRRKFLKTMAGLAALPVVGKFFKWAKPAAKAAKVADVTEVPIKNIEGMPAWFKPLVNKVIKEGERAKVTEYDRLITHTAKLPESKTPISVSQDLNTGDVWVDIGRDKHGFADGHYGQPVRLEYKAKEIIEPDVSKTGKVKSKGGEVKEEFWVEEAEFTGGHPENVKFEETSFNKFGDHGSNFDEVEKFATGTVKKKTAKESIKAERAHWVPEGDYASGGRVPLWKGSMVESAPRQEMQKEIDMREGIYEMYKKRADEWKEKRDEYYNSPKYHDDSPLYPEVFDGPIQHADRPPEPELQIGPYVPKKDTDYIVFDDGTVYYPEVDEYYKQDGTQVKGPSKGAKPEKYSETLEMEAAEGGRVPFVGGGWAFKLAKKYRQSKEYKKFIEKLFLKTSTDIRRGEGIYKNLSTNEKIKLHDDLTKEVTNYQKTGELPESVHQYFGFNPEQQYADRLLQKQLKMTPEQELRQEFPGITDDLLNQILTDTNQQRIAEVKATMKEALKMQEKGMGTDEIIQVIEKTPRTKNASGGLAHMIGE